MPDKFKALVLNILKDAGYALKKLENYTTEQQLLDAVEDVDALIIRSDVASARVMEPLRPFRGGIDSPPPPFFANAPKS